MVEAVSVEVDAIEDVLRGDIRIKSRSACARDWRV